MNAEEPEGLTISVTEEAIEILSAIEQALDQPDRDWPGIAALALQLAKEIRRGVQMGRCSDAEASHMVCHIKEGLLDAGMPPAHLSPVQ